jgi:hypothetical protein
MACRNEKKKLTWEDKFGRKYYCQHARLNSIREDKRRNKKKMRKINKKMCEKALTNKEKDSIINT